MRKMFIIFMLLLVAATAYSYPRASDGRNTFRNGYAMTGNKTRDNFQKWAEAIENLAETGSGIGRGKVWYVYSGVTNSGDGTSWEDAVSTLDPIFALITADGGASRGDVVKVGEGHNEAFTLANAADADVIGVTIQGYGHGSLMPTFDYDLAAGEFVIGADNVTLVNLRFLAGTPTTVNAIDIEDGMDYARIIGCVFTNETMDTDFFADAINLGDGIVGTLIEGNEMDSGAAAAASAIYLDYDSDGTIIRNNYIQGDYSTGPITGDTTLSTKVLLDNNILMNGSSGSIVTQPAIDLLTGTTGIVKDNVIVCNVATVAAAMETVDTMMIFGNSYNEDAGANRADKPWNAGGVGGTLNSVTTSGDD